MNDQEWFELFKDDLDRLGEFTASSSVMPQKITLKLGERRLITALFLDMKGFTSLSERFDHEFVDELVERLFTIFRNQIEKRGGWIEKYEGDAILAAFGAKQGHEDDAARAVDAAMAMLENMRDLRLHLSKRELAISIRIGINSGEVTRGRREDYDVVTGDVVNVAARLEQHAPEDSILASAETRRLAGEQFIYKDHPLVKAKGKVKPLRAYRVVGKAPRLERWQRSRLAARTCFVGREKELVQLLNHYRHCCQAMPLSLAERRTSSTRHLLIDLEGEAGMGKSRLVHEFAQALRAFDSNFNLPQPTTKPAVMLKGAAAAFAANPYEQAGAMLAAWLGANCSGAELKERAEHSLRQLADFAVDAAQFLKAIPFLLKLLGIGSGDRQLDIPDAKTLRAETAIAYRLFIEAAAAQAQTNYGLPLILVYEDFHWIDEPSREIMQFVLANARTPRPLMAVVLHRPAAPLPQFSENRVEVVRLVLDSLAQSDGIELIDSMLPGLKMPAPIRQLIQERGAGIPFYLEELAHHWVETGCVREEGRRYLFVESPKAVEIPATLRGLLIARIDALDREPKQVMQHASVLGAEFTYPVLSEIERHLAGDRRLPLALQHLAESSFIVPLAGQDTQPATAETNSIANNEMPQSTAPHSYCFKHILIREVVYSSLLHSNRAILHRLSAESIESIHAHELDRFYAQLAVHCLEANMETKAFDYFKKAGEQAWASYDNQAAISFYTQALALLRPNDEKEIPLLLARGEAAQTIGKMAEAQADFERSLALARELKDDREESKALPNLGNIHFRQGRTAEALQCYERSLLLKREIGDRMGEAQVILNIGNIHYSRGEYETALADYRQSLAMQEELGDRKGQGESANNLGALFYAQGQFETALGYFQESLRLRQQIGNRKGECESALNIGTIHLVQGRSDEAEVYFEQCLAIALETGDLQRQGQAINNLGNIHMNTGNLEQARQCFQQSLEICEEMGDRRGVGSGLLNLGNVERSLGNVGQAIKLFHQAMALQQETGDRRREAQTLNNLGLANYDNGYFLKAEHHHRQAHEIREALHDRKGISDSLINLGKIHYARGFFAQAASCYQEALEIKLAIKDRDSEGYAHNNLGDALCDQGKLDEALRCYEKALTLFKELKDQKGAAVATANSCKIFMRRGNYTEALRYGKESMEIRERLGDRRKIAFMHRLFGDLSLAQGLFDEASAHYARSLSLARESGDRPGAAFSLHALGEVNYLVGRIEPAASSFREALAIRIELEQDNLTAYSQSMLARVLVARDEFQAALSLSERAVRWLQPHPAAHFFHFSHPEQILFTHYLALLQSGDPLCSSILEQARRHFQDWLSKLADEERQTVAQHPMYFQIINDSRFKM